MNFIAFAANNNGAWRFRTCSITFHQHQFIFSLSMETKEWERKIYRIYNSKIRFSNTALFTPSSLLLCNLVKHEFQGNRPLHLASFQSNFQFITIIYAMSWWFSIKYLLIMWHMLINRAHFLSLSLALPRVIYDFIILFAKSYCLLVFVNSQFGFLFVENSTAQFAFRGNLRLFMFQLLR